MKVLEISKSKQQYSPQQLNSEVSCILLDIYINKGYGVVWLTK